MTLDARARRAASDFHDAVESFDRFAPERGSFERFDRFRRQRQRNARIGVTLVASVLAIASIFFLLADQVMRFVVTLVLGIGG